MRSSEYIRSVPSQKEDILILAIDIGNTNIDVGCIRGDEVLFTERLSTNTTHTTLEYAISFKNVLEIYQIDAKEIEGAIISSVVPADHQCDP